MGWFTNALDRLTGADRRVRQRILREVAESPSISPVRKERLSRRIGGDNVPEERERRWDSAKTTRLNQGHWSPVTGQPINADLAGWLTDLRNRSEYELANNALVAGMVETYSLTVVGSEGPQLSVITEDEKYQLARARIWNAWCQQAGSNQQLSLVEILGLWIRSLFGAGEFLTQMVTVDDVTTPVKMRLLPVAARRLMTDPRYLGDPEVALGVRRDLKNRRPKSYYISQPYVMGAYELYQGKFDEVPYRDMIHGFRMVEEDQIRGVPWLAPCLDTIADHRDFKSETLDAARAAADYAVLLSSNSVDAPFLLSNETTSIERRTIRTLPPGWLANQMAPAHPGPQYDMFYESLAREFGGPICMPLMMLLLDSSSHNYSSARFDGQMFWRGVGKTQGWLGRILLRIEAIVALEAELAGELPPPPKDLQLGFIWPRAPHVDPTKEATAERMNMENGTISYSEACAAHNKSAVQMIAQRKKDNEALIAAGLPPIPGIPDGNAQPAPPAGDDAPQPANKPVNGKPINGNGRFAHAV